MRGCIVNIKPELKLESSGTNLFSSDVNVNSAESSEIRNVVYRR